MTAPTTAFATLSTAIKPLLPTGWKLVGYEDTIDEPDTTTVVLKLRSVQRLPAAPRGAYLTEWVVTVISSHSDPEKADPGLFDGLINFLDDLDTADGLDWLGWTTAQKVIDSGRLAYDITIQTTTTKGA